MKERCVLIIDDDPQVAEFIAGVAELCGYEAVIAEEHRRFDDYYRQCDPSVVVSDLQMPGVDGVEVLRFLARENTGATVVLLSGFDPRVIASARRLGESLGLDVIGALTKPVAVAALKDLLQRAGTAPPEIDAAELTAAAAQGQFLLHYQPKICVAGDDTRRVTGVEALVRWQHPHRGLLQPGDFIEIAERSGAIVAVTEAVLEMAIAQAMRWRSDGLELSVAMNVAPQALNALDFPDRLAGRVASAGALPEQFVLEITETGAMEDSSQVMDILTRIRLKGFELSIDDFGTGYSSLVQLYRMPFSELKIDKSFVQGLGDDAEAEVIVRAVMDLAHNLSLPVCAEGIENEHAWNVLASLGCERAQGFYMSRPLPAEKLPEWIEQWHGSHLPSIGTNASATL